MQKTIRYSDERGYDYCETADDWKTACLALPCFTAVQWPDYGTAVIEDVIDGQPVVIQLWKGWCQKFLDDPDFPGGIGAEVGIYVRTQGKAPRDRLEHFPAKLSDFILGGLARVGGEHLWWPSPKGATITFQLVNPKTGDVFVDADAQTTYWRNKWLQPDSYEDYKKTHDTPIFSDRYQLRYTINGVAYEW